MTYKFVCIFQRNNYVNMCQLRVWCVNPSKNRVRTLFLTLLKVSGVQFSAGALTRYVSFLKSVKI